MSTCYLIQYTVIERALLDLFSGQCQLTTLFSVLCQLATLFSLPIVRFGPVEIYKDYITVSQEICEEI